MHARAFAEWAGHLYGDRVEVRVEHLLENSSWIGRQVVHFYNLIQRRAPWFHHAFFHLGEGLSLMHRGGATLGRRYYVKLLESFRPQVILSVHDCLNRGYFATAREVLGPQVRCVTFCLEFADGYGFSRNWADPTVDLFLGRTEECATAGWRFGIPASRCQTLGDLFPLRFSEPLLSDSGRRAFLVERLNLSANRLTLLLATGGTGANNHLAFVQHLAPLDVQVIALCGHDSGAAESLHAWSRRHPDFALRHLPFTDDMPSLLQSCSAIVARGGGIAAEALHFSCPTVFNSLGGTMPQEMPTIRYFRSREIASVAASPRRLAETVRRWLQSPDEFDALRRRVAQHRPNYDPARLVAAVLGEELPAKSI